jgi:hypothetical protein
MIYSFSKTILRQINVLAYLLLFCLSLLTTAEADRRLRPSVDEQAVVTTTNPGLNNPIDPSEKNRSHQIAENSERLVRAKRNATGRRKPRGLERLENVQRLYVERHDEGKNTDAKSRKADVVYYDYSKNQSIEVVVDLNNNTPLETVIKPQGVGNQPFFTRPEINAAMQLIFNHPQMGPVLRKAYQDVTGNVLTDVSALEAQGGVYFPDHQSKLSRLASACETNRCIQLFIPLNDTHFLDATNVVVNLSLGEVIWVAEGIAGHSNSNMHSH